MGYLPPTSFAPIFSDAEYWFGMAITFILLATKIYAFVTSLLYSREAYDAAGKLNKPTWCLLLGAAVLLQWAPIPIDLINLAMTVVTFVYLADVRPAIQGLRRR